jgi:hypothetical protein
MADSSFYGDTPNYATTYPTQNDSNTQPVDGNTQSPSSFYPNGGIYAFLSGSETLLAQLQALADSTTTNATAAANSAANASTSAANASTSAANASTSAANAASAATSALASAAGTATPIVDGTATVGTSAKWAHEDHVHPTDTSRASASATTSALSLKADITYVDGKVGTATPLVDGTAAVGVSAKWAHEDHVHPTDTTRAPLASPVFTGTPAAPTPTAGDNSTKLATTAWVQGNAIIGAVGQIPGTTGTTQPAAGKVGERISAATSFSVTTSGTAVSGGSITLTPGVWDIENFVATGGPGATTTTDVIVAVGTTSGSVSVGFLSPNLHYRGASTADLALPFTHPRIRVTVASNTPYYANMQATFSGASYGGTGVLQATRVS